MEMKRSNLCVALDVQDKNTFLHILDLVAPFVCMIKTHIDIIKEVDSEFIRTLVEMSNKHDFFIFEDRKFCDIGSTVWRQYEGTLNIVEWSNLVSAQIISGDGVVRGLKHQGLPKGNGVVLIAKMTTGTITDEKHADLCIRMASMHTDFCVGIMGDRRYSDSFLTFTPGVSLQNNGDELGQTYNTPEAVISNGADIIIIGRSIIESCDIEESCRSYRDLCWQLYTAKLK